MATDIQNILKQAQSVINTGVKTVKETRITADILQKNIEITDRKIGVHNVNEEAHPDIRAELESLFSLPNGTDINGPSVAEQNFATTWTLSVAGTDKNTFDIKYYRVYTSAGDVILVDVNEDKTGTFTYSFVGNDGDVVTFSATAVMTNNYRTLVSTKEITITKHTAPDISAMTTTFPSVVSYGKTYNWKIEGITDVDGDLSDISVTLNSEKAQLSQSTGIVQGTEYTLTMDDDFEGPGTLTATIVAKDAYGYTSTTSVDMRINQRPYTPNLTSLTFAAGHGLSYISGKKMSSPNMDQTSWGEYLDNDYSKMCFDPEKDAVEVVYSCDNPSIVVTPYDWGNGISYYNAEYGLTRFYYQVIEDITPGTPYTFTCTVTDEYGATSSASYSSTIDYPPDISNVVITGEIPDIVKAGDTFTFSVTGATDKEKVYLFYSFYSQDWYGNFEINDKTTYDENNNPITTFTVTVKDTVTRGTEFPFVLTCYAGSGSAIILEKTIKINTLPDVSNVSTPDLLVASGGTATLSMDGATDADGQELTYEWTCDNENVKILVSNGASALLKMPDESILARGSQCTLTLTVSDGLESVTKTCKATVNSLPVIPDGACTIPDVMVPGVSKTFTISGITDPDNNFSYIRMTLNSEYISITDIGDSDSEGWYAITDGREYGLSIWETIPDDIATVSYTIEAIDKCGEKASITKNITVHRNTATIKSITTANSWHPYGTSEKDATDLIKHLSASSNTSFWFYWTIPDDVDYVRIDSVRTSSNLSCMTGQAGSDSPDDGDLTSFYLVTSSAKAGDTYTITITLKDSYGATTTETITGTFNYPPVADNITCDLPEFIVPGKEYTLTVNGGGTDTETAEADLLYKVECGDSSITVSTHDKFAAGGSVTFTVSSDITRGTEVPFNIYVYDEIGDYAKKEFTTKVNTLPNADNVKCYVELVSPDSNNSFGNSGATDTDGQELTYTWTCSDDRITITNTPAVNTESYKTNSQAKFLIPDESTMPRGTAFTVTCVVSDGLESVSKTFNCKINELPDFTNAVITAPTLINPGKSYPFKFSGITDPEGALKSFQLCNTGTYGLGSVTILNADGNYTPYYRLEQDTDYTLVISNNIASSGTFSLTLMAYDSKSAHADKVIEMTINEAPDISNAEIYIPANLLADSSQQCFISGVTDPEGKAVTYSITSSDPNITFEPSSGIAIDDDVFTINTGAMLEGAAYTLTITFEDEDGGVTTKTISSTISKSPTVDNLTVTGPTVIVPQSTNTISFNGAVDPDGSTIVYSVSDYDSSVLTFEPSSGILDGEEVTLTTSEYFDRGKTYNYTVIATDDSGSTTSKNFGITINSLPDLSKLEIRSEFEPSSYYGCGYRAATDADGQDLTYTWTCSNDKVSITYDASDPLKVVIQTPSEDVLPRGTEFTLTCTVSDGLETVSKTLTCKIHELPDISKLTYNFPSVVSYGKTYDWSLSGSIPSGCTTVVSLDNINASLTATGYHALDTTYKLTAGENLIGPGTLTATIYVTDSYNTSSSVTVPMRINQKPLDDITLDDEFTHLNSDSGNSYSAYLRFKPDPDGDLITPSITCSNSLITFSPYFSYEPGDGTICWSMAVSKSAKLDEGLEYTLTVTLTDEYGASVSKNFTGSIATSPKLDKITSTLPAYIAPGSTQTITISGFTDDYGITSAHAYCSDDSVTISNETFKDSVFTFDLTTSSDISRGKEYSVSISASNKYEAWSSTDLTFKVNTLPDTSAVTLDLPKYVVPGKTYTVTASGATDADGQSLEYTALACNGLTITKTTDGKFNVTISDTIERGTDLSFEVTVSDGLETTTGTVTGFKVNQLPDLSNMKTTFPAVVSYGQTYTWLVDGITDEDSISTITVESDNAKAVLSSSTVTQGNTYSLAIADSLVGPGNVTFTITAKDGAGETASTTVTSRINQKPYGHNSSSQLSLERLVNGKTTEQSICWDADPDGDSVSCKMTCDCSLIKISNLADENAYKLLVTVPDKDELAEGTTYTFTLTFTDEYGAQTIETISGSIDQTPDASSAVCSLPTYVSPGREYTVNFSGFKDPDNDDLTFDIIQCDEKGNEDSSSTQFAYKEVTTSKTSCSYKFTPYYDLTRGNTYYFALKMTDPYGLSTQKVFSYKVNQLPNATNVTCTINDENICTPSTTYTITPGMATDADTDQVLSHFWSCDNPKATVVWDGTTLEFTSPSVVDMPRGNTCTLVYNCSDGCETIAKQFDIKMNSVPEGTLDVTGIPTEMYGGYYNRIKVTVGTGLTEADGHDIYINMRNIADDDNFDGYMLDMDPITESSSPQSDGWLIGSGGTSVYSASEGCTFYFWANPVETETTMKFTIAALDGTFNEYELSQQFTVTVKPVIRTSQPSVTSPAADATVEHENGFTATFSEYSSYTTTDEDDIAIWTNYKIAEAGVDTESVAYTTGYEEGNNASLA